MQIIMDASRNEEYVKQNPDKIQKQKENSEGSATISMTYREVYIPPEEEASLIELYKQVVVQDFDDDYHMKKSDRVEMQQRYEKFFKLRRGYTKRIRRLDKYVEAWRIVMEIINDLGKDNGLYEPDVFRKKVLCGDIVIPNLSFPKFQGKKKKLINWNQIAEYIIDVNKDIRDITNMEERAKESLTIPEDIISDDEWSRITVPPNAEDMDILEFRATTETVQQNIAAPISPKSMRWLNKNCGEIVRLSKKKGDGSKKKYLWELDSSELDALKSYDESISGKVTIPEFNGDFTDPDAVNAYLHKLDEYEEEYSYVEYNGRLVTLAQAREMEYAAALEAAGWNIRNLYNNKDIEKQRKKDKKADDKRIKDLRRLLADAQERSDLRKKGFTESEIDRIRSKQTKKSKKKKKKAKKKVDNIILDAVDSNAEDFKMYERLMSKM